MNRPLAACGGSRFWQQRTDVVVIGTGVAGLTAALAAHRQGRRVLVLNKTADTSTAYAQGGIAVVMPRTDDSVDAHVGDTLAAGGGLCDPDAVRSIVADGHRAVRTLVADGAHFDEKPGGSWALGREGGHTRRRIVHAGGDATGAEVQRALTTAAAQLDIRTEHVAVALLRDDDAITGVSVLSPQGPGIIHAPAVILASGGLGQLYTATTNPEGATGDGIALALWAGLPVADLEFIQFHPTMLYSANGGRRRPLITEALRGEGAVLVDARGERVMAGVHPMGDLAPRDVVAAAIDARLRDTGAECVYLDARHVDRIAQRFPTVTAACHTAGIDPTRRPIPVVPGAHYSCGGVVTDVFGRTELAGLYAAGEVARTGMHGANRLASNSLLEGLVVGGRAGVTAADFAAGSPARTAQISDDAVVPTLTRPALQQAMTRWASVVRDADGLRALRNTVESAASARARTRGQFEDGALTTTAAALAAAATARTESRGAHHRGDHPDADDALAHSATVRLVDGRALVETVVVC